MRNLILPVLVALSIAANVADAGCGRRGGGCGGGGRFFHRHQCQPSGNSTTCGQNYQPAACNSTGCQPAFPVAHAAGQVIAAPVRVFTGGRCGPNGCSP